VVAAKQQRGAEGGHVVTTSERDADPTQWVVPPPVDAAAEIVGAARADLKNMEVALRQVWSDAADLAPAFVARLHVAIRLIHNAAAVLSHDAPADSQQ
jgi:hypothetical protein